MTIPKMSQGFWDARPGRIVKPCRKPLQTKQLAAMPKEGLEPPAFSTANRPISDEGGAESGAVDARNGPKGPAEDPPAGPLGKPDPAPDSGSEPTPAGGPSLDSEPATLNPPHDPDLARIIDRWPALQEHIKRAMLALVDGPPG